MGCRYADRPATATPPSEMRAAVVCLINQQRTMRGLPTLQVSAKLNRSAQGWNQWMVATGKFTHGSDFASRISGALSTSALRGLNRSERPPRP